MRIIGVIQSHDAERHAEEVWVAGIEEHRHAPGTVTVLAMPGHTIYPHINMLIASRRWKINSLSLEPGRLNDVVHHLSQEAPL